MCGIIGLLLANQDENVNQLLFDGLTVLQHRGQDAAGIVTSDPRGRLHLRKDNGLVKDVFHTHHMIELCGNVGLGHVRYPTAGSSSCAEAQPLYTNYPFGLCVAHNGNLVNTEELRVELRENNRRHINTDSDSELLLNIFAEALASNNDNNENQVESVFKAVSHVFEKCQGGYAGIYLINGIGLVGFRDPHGIRPIVFGSRQSKNNTNGALDYVFASESVAIDTLRFNLVRDIKPGEAIFIDFKGNCHTRQCHPNVSLAPCIFEYVYFARPDSIMDGVSVYESRLIMGEKLAHKIMNKYPDHDIDVVIPIPDTSRTSALQAAYILGRPFREGFIKNRYIARTFIMPGQETRKKSVRLKLNTIKSEFAGRNVLLVDDSVVRGTTAREIVDMAREAGAVNVYFASAAPAIRYPNIYGIDIPTRNELVAYEREEEEIAEHIGCNWIVYQDTHDLEDAVRCCASEDSHLREFDTSCFTGKYVTGQSISDEYFQKLHSLRNDAAKESRKKNGNSYVPVASDVGATGCESVHNDQRDVDLDAGKGCEGI
jgi:amidophosphoribosyltransferase